MRIGSVRLIFVANSSPKDQRRLLELLNEKMADVKLLEVEVKQFLGSNQKALVPRMISLTEAARERKPTTCNHEVTNCETMLAPQFPNEQ